MTIKATYNTLGEKVSPFPMHPGQEYKVWDIGITFPPFDGNNLAVYKGTVKGYYLTILHENEPVVVIVDYPSKEELLSFIHDARLNCERFNPCLYDDDLFFTYYLLHQQRFYGNPCAPGWHLLLKHVEDMENFHKLFSCYESLYTKCKEYDERMEKDPFSTYLVEDFCATLTEDELNILKFSIFCKQGDCYCASWRRSYLAAALPNLKTDAFKSFGIEDDTIDLIFRTLKMHRSYFSFAIRNAISTPSVYYIDNGCELSYLTPEDEVILWRSGSVFREYLADNFTYVKESNEPEDRG